MRPFQTGISQFKLENFTKYNFIAELRGLFSQSRAFINPGSCALNIFCKVSSFVHFKLYYEEIVVSSMHME